MVLRLASFLQLLVLLVNTFPLVDYPIKMLIVTPKDTGTTLVLLATDGFNKYVRATGAVQDNNTGLLRLTTSQFANLQSLFFTTNGVSNTLFR